MAKLKKFYKRAEVIEHPDSDQLPKLGADEKVTFNNLSKSHGPYFGIALDGRLIKTIYKDPLRVGSRALAVALCEEWESQEERFDLKTLYLNQMIAKAIRAQNDPVLASYFQEQIQVTLENDQVCFREDPESQNDYKKKLGLTQEKYTQQVHDFVKKRFNISLKIWHNIPIEPQDKSIANINPILAELDPIVLNSIF